MQVFLLIGAGSFLGGIFRYLLMTAIQSRILSTFPYGTLGVNVLGGLVIGIVMALSARTAISPEWKLFLATGICGGFTTFSAFSHEAFTLIRDGLTGQALLYISASILLSVLATYVGYFVTEVF